MEVQLVTTATRARRTVRQKAKGPIDPAFGAHLRQLREARGLTQSQLAANDFSKGFISLLETGRTRASLRAAEILAARLGVPVTDLMRNSESAGQTRAQLELLRAQREIGAGSAATALKILDEAERVARGPLRPQWLRLRGRALAAAGRQRDAITILDAAARAFRSAGDREAMARSLFDLAGAYAGLDQQGEALNLGLQVEHVITEGGIVDRTLELQVLAFLAGVLVNLGDIAAADLRMERARAVAEDVTDLRTVADMFYSLAVTRQEQGDGEAALAYIRKSIDAFQRLEDHAAIASTWNTLGWIYTKRDQYTRAEEALDRAEKEAGTAKYANVLPWILQSRAELELARGNSERALEQAEASLRHPSASARSKAMSSLVRAEALARGKVTDSQVIRAFDQASSALEPFGRRLQARAYQSKFAALAKRGRLKESNQAAGHALELLQPAVR
ncbi:MAG: helix-turn-helix transcriptional regulator [Gemmatimonadota bacterium]|nr:helix-turn-helix transcriptional regulator [Gemmatimonadota bacterium]